MRPNTWLNVAVPSLAALFGAFVGAYANSYFSERVNDRQRMIQTTRAASRFDRIEGPQAMIDLKHMIDAVNPLIVHKAETLAALSDLMKRYPHCASSLTSD